MTVATLRSGRGGLAGHRDAFLTSGDAGGGVRSVVADSWMRSSASGVDPDRHLAPIRMDRPEVQTYRSAHPLAQVFPLLYDVLGRAAVDCDCVMAVGDADGTLLWVTGSPTVMRRAETIHFVEGAGWDEGHAGTNAPGMALHLDAATHVRSEEHFNRLVQPWTCAAAPIHDPSTQQILGLVDITGGPDVATPQSLALVRAAARMAESELARLQATGALWTPAAPGRRGSGDASLGPDPSAAFALRGLGQPELIAAHGGRTHRLSRRHGDILVALADHPDGLTAEQLEVLVYAGQVTSSTMRAEMTRLRSILGPEVLTSRPYRLIAGAQTDWHAVAAYLAAGRLRAAMQAYRGPLLPMSQSPAVVDQREILTGQVRSALIASAEADLMVAWTRSRWGPTTWTCGSVRPKPCPLARRCGRSRWPKPPDSSGSWSQHRSCWGARPAPSRIR